MRGESNAQLRVPACTAYLDPDPEGAHVSTRSGITGWQDPGLKVLWFGELKHAGDWTARSCCGCPPEPRAACV